MIVFDVQLIANIELVQGLLMRGVLVAVLLELLDFILEFCEDVIVLNIFQIKHIFGKKPEHLRIFLQNLAVCHVIDMLDHKILPLLRFGAIYQ